MKEKKFQRGFIQLKIGFFLFLVGLIGVLSLLTFEIPLPAEAKEILSAQFTSTQIKLLLLINPTILLICGVISGTLLYNKLNFQLPVFEKFAGLKNTVNYSKILTNGILGGLLAGVLISLFGIIYTPILPVEFIELGEALKPSLAARFLYGGFTEEIMMRFGVMTLIIWILSKIFKRKVNWIYWLGIIIAALLFALAHFPVAFQALTNPSSSLLIYILIGNSIGGIIFGWLYWKKGLESAFIGHLITHIVLLSFELIFK